MSLVFPMPLHAKLTEYEQLKSKGEAFYTEGSYGLAYEVYLKADALQLPPSETRWVDFRTADTMWRSQAATQSHDSTKYEKARRQLEVLVRDIKRQDERDYIWAEVQESLGDFWWLRRNSTNWYTAWPYYQKALDRKKII